MSFSETERGQLDNFIAKMEGLREKEPPVMKEVDRMNNFFLKLPDDFYPEIPGEPEIRPGAYRQLCLEHNHLDIPHGETTQDGQSKYSPLYLSQTPRQIFMTVDELVEELGLRKILDKCTRGIHRPLDKKRDKLRMIPIGDDRIPFDIRLYAFKRISNLNPWKRGISKIALPVFESMLEMGYSRTDLVT